MVHDFQPIYLLRLAMDDTTRRSADNEKIFAASLTIGWARE
jgi:hypothetical protein